VSGICPNCGASEARSFYRVPGIPVNSCLLVASREEALRFPTGDLDLAFCSTCGFVFNSAFNPEATVYSDQYEETQGFSSTFRTFHRQLAESLIERHRIVGKDVVEIGCGKGEFLALLCELGQNRGLGFDPSFVPSRLTTRADVRVMSEFFSETSEVPASDLICCKMTLEHILQTGKFLRAVRNVASLERGTIVFFQVPDARRILEERAFWDIYYEHCSYFTPVSLAYLFRITGFEILDLWDGYDRQYLMIEGRPSSDQGATRLADAERREREALSTQVSDFSRSVGSFIQGCKAELSASAAAGRRTVLWGSGSKAVAFLTTTNVRDEIEYVVDINPHRHGRFIPGTGQRIVSPSFLKHYQPDRVVAMNPIYLREIEEELERYDCRPQLLSINQLHPAIAATALS
jgi:hypothetical protein